MRELLPHLLRTTPDYGILGFPAAAGKRYATNARRASPLVAGAVEAHR